MQILSQTAKIEECSIFATRISRLLIYVYNGELTVTLNGDVYILKAESAMLISPDDFYYLKENGAHYSVLSFCSDDISSFESKALNLEYTENELLKALLQSDDQNQRQAMLQLFLLMCGKYLENIQAQGNKKIRLYNKAVSLMERYIASDLSVEELTEILGISLSMLKRIFAEYTAVGVHEYFLMLKIKKAKQLLTQGSSVTHTARVLQFSSQAYFSATFKRVTGISAKAYCSGKRQIKATATRQRVYKKAKAPSGNRSQLPDYLL